MAVNKAKAVIIRMMRPLIVDFIFMRTTSRKRHLLHVKRLHVIIAFFGGGVNKWYADLATSQAYKHDKLYMQEEIYRICRNGIGNNGD
ncbi:hypothetical protein D3C75_686980 [compost metagenome]